MNIFNTTVLGVAIKTVTNKQEVKDQRHLTDNRRSMKDSTENSYYDAQAVVRERILRWSSY